MAQVHEHMAIAYRCFHSIAYRFYNSDLVGNLFLATEPDPGIRAGLITLLAGDVWRSDNRFQDLLLQARRGPDESAPWFVDRLL
jgi:hypothetical protein